MTDEQRAIVEAITKRWEVTAEELQKEFPKAALLTQRDAEALRACLAAAAKPPVVVGLTDAQIGALQAVRHHYASHQGYDSIWHTVELIEQASPGEYVAVKRGDFAEAIELAMEYEGDAAVYRLTNKYCPEVRQAIDDKHGAIAKGGEPGGAE
jgi:hypothetical protein